MMIANRPGPKLLFISSASVFVGFLGLAFDLFLMRGGVPRLAILLVSNIIIGAIGGILFIQIKVRRQEKLEIVQDRATKVADINHHVRNALAVVSFYGTQGGNAASAERVSAAVKRIEWTLREVLPKGWDLQPSTGILDMRKRAKNGASFARAQIERF